MPFGLRRNPVCRDSSKVKNYVYILSEECCDSARGMMLASMPEREQYRLSRQ